MTSSGVPSATTWPPCTPAPGPMSTSQSAVRIASSSCSTTMHRVAEVAQPLQRLQQPRVVALVQPDRRLVEHIEHAGQPRADLRGQPDALALAARQRARGARQGQVVEPDIVEEAQPLVDLLQDAGGDLLLARGQRRGDARRTSRTAVAIDSAVASLMLPAGDLDRQRLGLEPGAVADLAGLARSGSAPSSSRTQALSVSRKRRSMFGNTPSNGRSVEYCRSPSS